MSAELKNVPPNTARLIEGFRDTGYSFNAAIADIVDNSIAAEAANVCVHVGWMGGDEPFVWVSDDGNGMDAAGLENAMRYGSDERDDPHSLGRFGLGLKTASTSFCRSLSVVSLCESGSAVKATWDLDVVAAKNEWLLEIGAASAEDLALLEEGLEVASDGGPVVKGTLVTWEKIDRLLRTKAGREAKNKVLIMERLCDSLSWHLRTVFQRFLDSEDVRVSNVNIFLNDVKLEPWDPFCEQIGAEMVKSNKWTLESPRNEKFDIALRAFILPRPEEFATEEERRAARISNERQGIYLYREDRLIEGPDWLGLGAADTHFNNLRIELSFPAPLDEVFGVGIKKSGVHLDSGLLHDMDKLLAPIKREANRRSRKGSAVKNAASGAGARPTETTISRTMKSLTLPALRDSGKGVILTNNAGDIAVTDEAGKSTGYVRLLVDSNPEALSVIRKDSLEDGALWMASLGQNRIQVALNTGHDWYRKAYLTNAANGPLVQAIEFLFFALAQAEMNNTTLERDDMFEEFRLEVSRNLRKLVKDLPEPDED